MTTPVDMSSTPPLGNPDHAWKALGLVNDWVKHAETKAAGTLTASFVTGGLLYNMVKGQTDPSRWLTVFAVACIVAIVMAAVAAGWSLRPRLRPKDAATSLLYFDHIARRHARKDGPDCYVTELLTATSDDDAITEEIGKQIWANSHVARSKYQASGVALLAVLFGVAMLALSALTLALESS